jgi:hypothetical protein
MSSLFLKHTLLSVPAVAIIGAVLGIGLSAQAETTDFSVVDEIATLSSQNSQSTVAQIQSAPANTSVEEHVNNVNSVDLDLASKPLSESTLKQDNSHLIDLNSNPKVIKTTTDSFPGESNRKIEDNIPELTATTTEDVVKTEQLLDRTVLTSASALTVEPTEAQLSESATETTEPVVAQVPVTPGRVTRSGPSYIGIGGNLGLTGRTALSRGSFSVISKIGLTRNFSARPSAVIGDRTVFMVPLTLDFPIEQVENIQRLSVAPYVGGGLAVSTGRDSRVGALLTGGVDVPVIPNITATAGVNAAFLRRTEVGLLVGVGYNF